MSEIKVGDLVVVVRPGCGEANLGRTFTVNHTVPLLYGCHKCGTFHGDPKGTTLFCEAGQDMGFPAWRLKKIPPLPELESQTEKKELTA